MKRCILIAILVMVVPTLLNAQWSLNHNYSEGVVPDGEGNLWCLGKYEGQYYLQILNSDGETSYPGYGVKTDLLDGYNSLDYLFSYINDLYIRDDNKLVVTFIQRSNFVDDFGPDSIFFRIILINEDGSTDKTITRSEFDPVLNRNSLIPDGDNGFWIAYSDYRGGGEEYEEYYSRIEHIDENFEVVSAYAFDSFGTYLNLCSDDQGGIHVLLPPQYVEEDSFMCTYKVAHFLNDGTLQNETLASLYLPKDCYQNNQAGSYYLKNGDNLLHPDGEGGFYFMASGCFQRFDFNHNPVWGNNIPNCQYLSSSIESNSFVQHLNGDFSFCSDEEIFRFNSDSELIAQIPIGFNPRFYDKIRFFLFRTDDDEGYWLIKDIEPEHFSSSGEVNFFKLNTNGQYEDNFTVTYSFYGSRNDDFQWKIFSLDNGVNVIYSDVASVNLVAFNDEGLIGGNGYTKSYQGFYNLDFNLYRIYPNPFNKYTEMSISTNIDGRYDLNIYNILGRVVYTRHISLEAGYKLVTWNPSTSITTGPYFVIWSQGSNILAKRKITYIK